jgi:hypothetical protein
MYSKTCPIPVKNVRDKLIEMTPLSSLLSDWTITSIKKRLDDYDRLTDWIRPLARGLAIYSLTDSWKPNLPRVKLAM